MNSYVHVGWCKRSALISHREKSVYHDALALPDEIRKLIVYQATVAVDKAIKGMIDFK